MVAGGALYALDVRRKQKRVREERARRARVDLALNRGRCGLWTWDLERGRIQWSASMFDLLGIVERPSHWTIAGLQALVHPEDVSLEAIARAAAERRGQCVDVEFRMRAADGRWVWLRKRAEIVEDEETGAASLVGIAFDVTERRREAELSATADQRLRDAIEAISEAFVAVGFRPIGSCCATRNINACAILPAGRRRARRAPTTGLAAFGLTRRAIRSSDDLDCSVGEPALRAGHSRTLTRRSLADGRWLQVNERRTRDGGYRLGRRRHHRAERT